MRLATFLRPVCAEIAHRGDLIEPPEFQLVGSPLVLGGLSLREFFQHPHLLICFHKEQSPALDFLLGLGLLLGQASVASLENRAKVVRLKEGPHVAAARARQPAQEAHIVVLFGVERLPLSAQGICRR